MNYKFTYKSQLERRTFNQKLNKFFSEILFYLYRSWLFKKMKLDRNGSLKSLLEYNEDRKTIKSDQYILPDNLNFSVFSITFLDCIQIEDSNRLKKRLLKTVSQYKHIPYKDPSRGI